MLYCPPPPHTITGPICTQVELFLSVSLCYISPYLILSYPISSYLILPYRILISLILTHLPYLYAILSLNHAVMIKRTAYVSLTPRWPCNPFTPRLHVLCKTFITRECAESQWKFEFETHQFPVRLCNSMFDHLGCVWGPNLATGRPWDR